MLIAKGTALEWTFFAFSLIWFLLSLAIFLVARENYNRKKRR